MSIERYAYCETCGLAMWVGNYGYELRYEIFKLFHLTRYSKHEMNVYNEHEWENKWTAEGVDESEFPLYEAIFGIQKMCSGLKTTYPKELNGYEVIDLPEWLWNEHDKLYEEAPDYPVRDIGEETAIRIVNKYRSYLLKKKLPEFEHTLLIEKANLEPML